MNASYVRGRMFNLCLLATALAMDSQPDEACLHARDALTINDFLRSARADVYVERLFDALRPYATTRDVQALDEIRRDAARR